MNLQNIENSFGIMLSSKREELRISVEDVSATLKVKKNDIIALEQGNLKMMTKNIYLPGFIKSYGKVLKIRDDIIEEYIKNIVLSCNIKNQKHKLINLDIDNDKNPSKDDLVNAALIIVIIYLLFISLNQINVLNITDLIVNQFNLID